MKKTILYATVFAFLFCSLLVPVSPVQYEPGCEKGQYVVYDITEKDPEKPSSEEIDKIRVEILKVTGNNVTYTKKTVFGDGKSERKTVSKLINQSESWQPVIAGGLSKGDRITEWGNAEISGSTTKYYWRAGRVFTLTYYHQMREEGNASYEYEYSWHKKTGFLMESYFKHSENGSTYEWEQKVVNTNIGFPWLWTVAGSLIIIGILISILVYRKKQ